MGSGKSTLQKLMMGLFQPSSGSIFIDGIESRQVDPAEFRKHIAYVPQDINLFYGSIKDNIVLSAPHVTDQQFLKAAKLGGVTQFTNKHPQGLNLQVGEQGRLLSGGQRQSIAIARALLRDPPVMIFDEPSSGMDDQSESAFKKTISNELKDKSLILITHRGSMLSLVDRLIVLENGRVLLDGPKDAVLDSLSSGKVKHITGGNHGK